MTEAGPIPDAFPDIHYDDGPDVQVLHPRGRSRRMGIAGTVENRLLGAAEDGKLAFLSSFDGLVSLVRELAASVDSIGIAPVATYVHQAADMIGDLQQNLRDRPVDELLDDGRDLIRRQPEVAIGVAVLAGFLAARLVKSSAR